jgi:outer membrane protein TolC
MPVIPPKTQLPDLQISLKDLPDEQLKKDITWAQMNRPEIKLLEMEKNQEQLQLKYAKNLYKPQLDVDVGVAENANNSSVNPNRGNDPNNYVNLNFSVPLEQRKAKGSTQQAEFRLMSLEHNQQLAKEQITTELEQIKVQINNLLVTHGNLEQEVELAGLLEKAERERFSHGASNFFLVNLREQDTAESAAALNEIAKQYKVALADYQFAVFDTKI